MFKDYIILDSVLENAEEWIKCSREITYYQHRCDKIDGIKVHNLEFNDFPDELKTGWRGLRSDFLHKIDKDLFDKTFKHIFKKILQKENMKNVNLDYSISSFLHFAPENIQIDESAWHIDHSIFAGVIYLNKDPTYSGTKLLLNDKVIEVENKFNRLLMYKSSLLHRPFNLFGDNIENTRLTISFFINRLSLEL